MIQEHREVSIEPVVDVMDYLSTREDPREFGRQMRRRQRECRRQCLLLQYRERQGKQKISGTTASHAIAVRLRASITTCFLKNTRKTRKMISSNALATVAAKSAKQPAKVSIVI